MAAQSSGRTGVLIAGLGFGAAVGIAFGTFMLAPNLPGTGEDGSTAQRASRERIELTQERDEAQAQNDAADAAFAASAQGLVDGALADRTVLVIATDTADAGTVDGVSRLLEAAGAHDGGRITLAESFFDSDSADQLKSIVATTLPAGARLSEDDLSPGTHAGNALAPVLFADPETGEAAASREDRELLLQALIDAGYIATEGTLTPADAIVLISGDEEETSDASFSSQEAARFARALGERGTTAVGAGYHAASSGGTLGLLRSEAGSDVTTVDSIDRAWARASLILATQRALDGSAGAYGAADNAADGTVPGTR